MTTVAILAATHAACLLAGLRTAAVLRRRKRTRAKARARIKQQLATDAWVFPEAPVTPLPERVMQHPSVHVDRLPHPGWADLGPQAHAINVAHDALDNAMHSRRVVSDEQAMVTAIQQADSYAGKDGGR